LQKTHFKSPRSGADHLLTNIESYFNQMCSDETLNCNCAKLIHWHECARKSYRKN